MKRDAWNRPITEERLAALAKQQLERSLGQAMDGLLRDMVPGWEPEDLVRIQFTGDPLGAIIYRVNKRLIYLDPKNKRRPRIREVETGKVWVAARNLLHISREDVALLPAEEMQVETRLRTVLSVLPEDAATQTFKTEYIAHLRDQLLSKCPMTITSPDGGSLQISYGQRWPLELALYDIDQRFAGIRPSDDAPTFKVTPPKIGTEADWAYQAKKFREVYGVEPTYGQDEPTQKAAS